MIVLLAAVVVVCAGVVVVAIGRGGQLAEFPHDAPPLGLPVRRPIAGTDVALLRLPAGPWGYSFRSTDDALRRIAHALTERDTRIAILEQQVSDLRAGRPERPDDVDDDGSPWFDRSASFEGRPARPPLTSSIRAIPRRTSEPPAAEAERAIPERPEETERPRGVFEDDVEPFVEPLPETARIPSPGDRLVASSHGKAAADVPEDTHADEAAVVAEPADDDEDAGTEPRGEGH